MKALMVFISNHYKTFKCLKVTNESDPNGFKMGKNLSGFEARKAAENLKYVTQIQGGGGGWPVLAKVKVGNPISQ
jgi:hypothetical protein